MQRKSLAPTLAVLGGAIVLAIVLVVASRTTSEKKRPNTSNLNIVSSINEMLRGIQQQGIALGNPQAKLTLVEFADLQCYGCSWFSENVLPELIQNYVRKGKLRIELEGQTIIDSGSDHDSTRLLRMALAAGEQNRLWNFVEIVYANQGAEDSGYATDTYLEAIARAVPGLNVAKSLSDRRAKRFTSVTEASGNRYDALHFIGTPSFLLGRTGEKLTEKISKETIPSYEEFAAIINAQLRS